MPLTFYYFYVGATVLIVVKYTCLKCKQLKKQSKSKERNFNNTVKNNHNEVHIYIHLEESFLFLGEFNFCSYLQKNKDINELLNYPKF